ncbi:maleylpyruvate isomerase family mycothiol-dependent enzyme [Mycolicibacterium komossense]|uniref:Maleylpyruvate isomerase family mycothiol-dependent enzyme n=1 Tax=Mycolicibacterium komossense TaxID=1779 RepID=A0ABT3C4W0_9MYCO|nr:maleylpyruvate isomerase family mycothiol-dependent enzyme [Mycolicibacterium komossense]MCV7224519.1 maleylpyruvate isomerase family mycothiol-dependent enzyme [Mycolicibacterium komossense]
MALATAERADLAALAAELSPAQWDAPTLCTGWRVRDVVAHTISFDGLGAMQLAAVFAKGLLSVDRINDVALGGYAERTTDQLRDLMRTHTRPAGLATGSGGRIALTDNMIHQQDIRRPLGLPRTIPPDRLLVALQFARTAPLIRGAWRARGVRLQATDLDWAAGNGPVVEGPGEALLMAMAARPAALADLDGPGVGALAAHIHR